MRTTNRRKGQESRKTLVTSVFVRVILAQGPSAAHSVADKDKRMLSREAIVAHSCSSGTLRATCSCLEGLKPLVLKELASTQTNSTSLQKYLLGSLRKAGSSNSVVKGKQSLRSAIVCSSALQDKMLLDVISTLLCTRFEWHGCTANGQSRVSIV